MNRLHLAAFAAVAEGGNFTRAAEALGISQPAVSSHIADLESALKVKLFDRLPRGARATEAGRLLLDHARRIAAAERDAEQAIAEWTGLARGRLAVGASTTVGAYLLPRLLGRFRVAHPSIDLDVAIANTDAIETRLRDGRLDVCLTEGFGDRDGLVARVFHTDELVLIAPPTHALARAARPIDASALADHPFIQREPGSGTREVIEAALKRRRIAIRPSLTLASTEAIKQAVRAGLGIAIVSRLTVSLEIETKRLAFVPLAQIAIRRPLHLLQRARSPESPAVAAFKRLLTSEPRTGDKS